MGGFEGGGLEEQEEGVVSEEMGEGVKGTSEECKMIDLGCVMIVA